MSEETAEQRVERWRREEKEREQKARALVESQLPALIEKIAPTGAKNIYIFFSGSGDEGYIQEVYAFTDPDDPDSADKDIDLSGVKDEIEEWAYLVFDSCGTDMSNNEGGFGHITINVVDRSVSYETNYNVVESVTDKTGEFTV